MNPQKRALIIGVQGQDGALLAQQLVAEQREVVGLDSAGRLQAWPTDTLVDTTATMSLADASSVDTLIREGTFGEVYYLAAFHHSSTDDAGPAGEAWARSWAVHCQGLLHVLAALERWSPECALVYASSSHVFGSPAECPQTERTPMAATTPYGLTKAAGTRICASYRARGMRASAAILYNHESPRRRASFVTQKIAAAVAQAHVVGARSVTISLRDPQAEGDWMSAHDAVNALTAIAAAAPDDYIVASGERRTVQDLCAVAAKHKNLEPIIVQETGDRGPERRPFVGDARLLHDATRWTPRIPVEVWLGAMVDHAVVALGDRT